MIVEVLFPEICNLFGDHANMRYLKLCLKDAEFKSTSVNEKPRFLTEKIDLVYMGPSTEKSQETIIKNLSKYKSEIAEKIKSGVTFFFTGNALEVLGRYIETEKGEKIPALDILPLYAKRNMIQRHNSECLAKFEGMEILGFKSQFTLCYPDNEDNGLFLVEKGMGMNMESQKEGIRINNFFGTYLLGPFLVLNPDFTKYLIKTIGGQEEVAFEEDVKNAHEKLLTHFKERIPQKPPKYKYM